MSPNDKASARVERGCLYLSAERRRVWQRVFRIAHADGRSDEQARELMHRAIALALEQHLARKAGD